MGSKRYSIGSQKWTDENGRRNERTLFNWQYKVKPGFVDIPPDLLAWAIGQDVQGWVMLNQNVKKSVGRSKDWGWERWLELASRAPYSLLQCDFGKPLLPDVRAIATPTFEHGAALLRYCRGIVTTEGGMHHAAGALMKSAVVIFGGTNPPSVLGYDFHENLAVDVPDALGRRGDHPSCREAMAMITVDRVLDAMRKAFG